MMAPVSNELGLCIPEYGIYIAYIESVCLQRYQEATERNGVHD